MAMWILRSWHRTALQMGGLLQMAYLQTHTRTLRIVSVDSSQDENRAPPRVPSKDQMSTLTPPSPSRDGSRPQRQRPAPEP